MDQYEILQTWFGYTSFRAGQEKLIDAILSGCDVFGVMPTGGGKSLCYQVPAMLLPGITIVISPLIALMRDQVMSLRAVNIPAACINSALSAGEYRRVCENLRGGAYKILYIAPERLDSESFAELARRLPIALLAVDEAHCISQWGQDFRPSYLKIADFVRALPRRPVMAAFTATATTQVQEDVARLLELRDPLYLVTGFDRPNLRYEVIRSGRKDAELKSLLGAHPGQSGIVYCATRGKVEAVCEELRASGVSATRYHAGLSAEERHANQEDFVHDRRHVMVATNAFGMGIDKSDVRFVIHYNMPKSLEEYYQEAGRAGRDGEAADCVLLFSPGDVMTARYLIENGESNNGETGRETVIEREFRRLSAMADYCKTTDCLRGRVLDYFGQAHPKACGNCGNCLGVYDEVDITTQAQMALSCVKRIRDRLGYSVGMGLLVRTLRGSGDKRIRDLGLDQISTYGLLRAEPAARIHEYIERLEDFGYLTADPRHGGIELTAAAGDVLFRGKSVTMLKKRDAPAKGRAAARKREEDDTDNALFETLRILRREFADREGVAAYIVFSDASLKDMARRKPRDLREFLEVSGVGKYKAEKYGGAFLRAIAEYEKERKTEEPD